MKIFTHINQDLDAVCAVWAARQFVPGAKDAPIEFRPANWDGDGMSEGDLALDMDAGGRGLKGEVGEDGVVHSCFALVVARYAPQDDQRALDNLVIFVDAQDAHGSAVKHLLRPRSACPTAEGLGYANEYAQGLLEWAYEAGRPTPDAVDVLAATGLNAVFRALQAAHPRNDTLVIERMSEILNGMLQAGRARQRAVKEADRAEILPGGQVAIVTNSREYATNGILFGERGVRVIVYVDGHNLGVIRHGDEQLRMDHPTIKSVVAEAGEAAEWFAHPAGFLYCRGSRKAPAQSPSRVDPRTLAEAARALLQVLQGGD